MTRITVGSRGSLLAVTQTEWVINRLRKAHPNLELDHKIIKTTGDLDQKTRLDKLAGMGVFVKELRTALLNGGIDCAVHSLKDVPEEEPEGLTLACFPEREDARDVFISRGCRFYELSAGSRVGTGSPRRVLQLEKIRPDLKYVSLRGNLDTRIRKVREGKLDGIVVAAAGVKRLNRAEEIIHYFSFEQMIPAIGQGALTIECRSADTQSLRTVKIINDDLTEGAVRLEREFMNRVGGGCKAPMASHVYFTGGGLRMMAILGDLKKKKWSRSERTAGLDGTEELVEEISGNIIEDCRDRGIPLPRDLPENALLQGTDSIDA
ncbi:hydroxymethylbilane synthase [Fibrobacterota bacterium]